MDEQTNETNSDDEDDAEDDNDTGLSGGPVLALDQLAHGASGNELLVDGGHCVLSGEFGYVFFSCPCPVGYGIGEWQQRLGFIAGLSI